MNLDQYISELLFEHDCVIIPGFGGIVTNYRSSFLNPAHHTFSPPSKKLAFNASLRNNDGLLANHLCHRLSLNYQEANNLINAFVEKSMSTLTVGKKLVFDRIGELYFDQEHNLQFVPDTNINYLKASFGLYTIHSPSIKRDDEREETVVFPHIRRKKNQSKKIRTAWKIMEVIPVAAMLAFLVLNPNVIKRLNQQAASFNPFDQPAAVDLKVTKHPEMEQANASKPAMSNGKKENEFDLPAASENKVDNSTAFDLPKRKVAIPVSKKEAPVINLKSDASVTSGKAQPIPEIKESPAVVAASSAKKTGKLYYIIGGCFSIFENAQNFRDQLISEGFQAAIIGQNAKGLHMVSFFSSPDMQSANQELVLIKEKAEAQAWLLHK